MSNQRDFNSYGSRRGNDRVMVRGTFANIRIRNHLAPGTEGGVTTYVPTGEEMSIYGRLNEVPRKCELPWSFLREPSTEPAVAATGQPKER